MTRTWVVLALLAIAFGAVLVHLSGVRLEAGESYPEYSTQRTDPMGARVLYDSLSHMPGLEVSRNFRPLEQRQDSGATFFLLDLGEYFAPAYAEAMEKLATRGNRVVIGLQPRKGKAPEKPTPIQERWHIDLPSREAVLERPFGKGAILIVPNTQVFHNQSMVQSRDTALLVRLIGASQRIVFDETHLGIEESGSIAGLARRYRLQGLGVGLALIAALFLWQNMSPFPPLPVSAGAREIAGHASSSGLTALLRRNVASEQLAATAWKLWLKSHARLVPARRVERAAALAAESSDPVGTLARMESALKSKGTN